MKWILLLVSKNRKFNFITNFERINWCLINFFDIAEGHRLIFDREVPFELRIHDGDSGPQEIGTLEAIRVKILALVIISIFILF